MFCRHCGMQLDDSAAFCANCGQRQETFHEPALPAEKKRRKKAPWIIAVTLVLVVAMVGGAVALALGGPRQTVYVLTSATHYRWNGDACYVTYSYNNRGYCVSKAVEGSLNPAIFQRDDIKLKGGSGGKALYEYEYDNHGNVIRQNVDICHPEGNWTEQFKYEHQFEYDEAGYPEAVTFYYNGEPTAEYRISCDQNGNVVQINLRNNNGEFENYRKCEYDDQGRLIYERAKNACYTEDLILEYSYDNDQLVCAENNFGNSWEFEYDSEGRLTQIERIYPHATYRFEYDRDGSLSEYTVHKDNAEVRTDEFGNVVEIIYEDGSRDVFEYEPMRISAENAAHYDNWISRKEHYSIRRYEDSRYYYMKDFDLYLIPDPIPNAILYR